MNADQRPALIAGPDDDLPSSLRLVLPTGLDRDQTLRGLVQAIQDVRTRLAAHAKQFQRLAGESAASGCQLRQALYRGQALANADAASAIDKSIIGVFGLWDQHEAQDPDVGGDCSPHAVPPGPGPALARHPAAGVPGDSACPNRGTGESLVRLSGTGKLADDLYLLAHHEVTGKPHLQPRAAGLGLAGALLAELMLSSKIDLRAGRIVAADPSLPEDELARSVLRQVVTEPGQLMARDWLLFFARTAAEDVALRLAQSGYLTRVPPRRPWRGERWVPVDPDCAFAPIGRVKSALGSSQHAAAQNAALAGLAAACGLGGQLALYLPPGAHHRLQEAAQQLQPSLRHLIAQTQAAVDSAVLSHRV